MNKDREAICTIISEMLDAPDDSGVYPTTVAYSRLEAYIREVRERTGQRQYARGWDEAMVKVERFCWEARQQ